jgi:signal transduction histidine kinase
LRWNLGEPVTAAARPARGWWQLVPLCYDDYVEARDDYVEVRRWLSRDRLAVAAALAAPLALIAILVPFRASFPNTDAALTLILVVVAVAAIGYRLAGVLAALSAAAWFDFFLTYPYERFNITRRADIETTILLLVIGVAVTELAVWGRQQHAAAAIANARAQAELTASRARIAATADETRRRIERDLHDGAQQRLVSLVLQLRAAQAAVPAELGELRAELDRVAAGLTSALEELREYARGIHPAILAERGLGPALRALARRSSVPVELDVRTKARLPERVELTAYYAVSEALANAVKHANASAVHVAVDVVGGVVRVLVSDDGVGGADPARGSGLVGLKDRVEAAGGTLIVQSCPGEGTRLVVELPVVPVRRRIRATGSLLDQGGV